MSLLISDSREAPLSRDHPGTVGDDALVQAALERTDDFAPLYERHAMAIYRYCFNQTRNVDVANDLTAQVFIRAIERLHQYRPRPGATFRSWLFAIARNIVVDYWRRHRPTRPVESVISGLVAEDLGPEELAVHRAHMESVLHAIDNLPEHYQAIVHLRLAGLTTQEIASTLGITESAMKSAQTRAYRLLRSALEPSRGETR